MLENSTKSDDDLCKIAVAPYAGAWIETEDDVTPNLEEKRRSLRGSVD